VENLLRCRASAGLGPRVGVIKADDKGGQKQGQKGIQKEDKSKDKMEDHVCKTFSNSPGLPPGAPAKVRVHTVEVYNGKETLHLPCSLVLPPTIRRAAANTVGCFGKGAKKCLDILPYLAIYLEPI
jgi:hypothetical protein